MAANPVTTGLQLELNAASITGLSDGNSVSSWADDSAQGNDAAQATGASQPTYRTSVFPSGSAAVRFVGNDDSMAGSFSAWSSGTGFTIILGITAFLSTTDNAGVFVLHSGSGNDFQSNGGITIECGAGATTDRLLWGVTHNNTNPLPGSSSGGERSYAMPNNPDVIGAGISATAYSACGPLGVVSSGTISRTIADPSGYVIGNRYLSGAVSTSFGASYDLGIAVVYDRLLSDTDFASVAQWISGELGLATFGGGTAGGGTLINGGLING